MANDGIGCARQRFSRLRSVPDDFLQGKARRFDRQDQAAGGGRGGRQHVRPFGRSGALRSKFLFLATFDFGGAHRCFGQRLRTGPSREKASRQHARGHAQAPIVIHAGMAPADVRGAPCYRCMKLNVFRVCLKTQLITIDI
jgi:hypothetical protein